MNSVTNARKTVLLVWIGVLLILFVGGLSSGDHLPKPKKFFGASVAYLGLAVAADFAAPVATAFAFAFGFYILLQNTGSISGINKLTSPGPKPAPPGSTPTKGKVKAQ